MDNLEPWTSNTIRPGQRYGRYTVLSTYRRIGTYRYYAYCQCDCGSKMRYVLTTALRRNEAQSCGCLHKERVTSHGAWGTPVFRAWASMLRRCTNPKDKKYPRYGGRGIQICERWLDPKTFIEDMQPTFKPGLLLERKNNHGNYEPDNCIWATSHQQNRNYSRNVKLTFNGETLCIADWAIKLNINYGTLWDRIKQGWSIERALTIPVQSIKKKQKNSL